MFLSAELSENLEKIFTNYGVPGGRFFVAEKLTGGDINFCYRLQAGGKMFFMKINSAIKFPDMLTLEAMGLKLIAASKSIRVPKVLAAGSNGNEQFLLLEWIETGIKSAKKSQEDLGRKLASMHMHTADKFGLEFDNYMGLLPQGNRQTTDFTDFFITHRLKYQLDIYQDKKLADKSLLREFENIFNRFDELYPHERPTLIHGDLWSGNYLVDQSCAPFLIDPAVSFSHREVDIAMTTLFGGFEKDFYRSYNEVFPLEEGWERRTALWNLYPLLVHVNLFGQSYLPQLKNNLAKFT